MTNPSESGILIVDKPQGVTSHDVVAAIRGGLRMKRVGHAGTLDPMATGVLVVGFGNATRLLNYIVGADKTYEATIRLGQFTTTDDADGDVMAWSDKVAHGGFSPVIHPDANMSGDIATLSQETIEQAIAGDFTGRIEQTPTMFSAIKINGKRAYDLAREGKDVELKARPITIREFTIIDGPVPATAHNGEPALDLTVRVTCSSGTYIRALARDLGYRLGVGGHLTMLRRTRVSAFDAATADVVTAHAESRTFTNRDGETITRNRCVIDYPNSDETTDADADASHDTSNPRRDYLLGHALPMAASARLTMPCADITADEARELRFGRWIPRRGDGTAAAIVPASSAGDSRGDELVAIIEPANRRLAKPVVVFPAEQPD
ncbi:tRNA pseudouridine(55) synthase TruB [Bifidobacterium sp. 82T24]|uniref:tRNA pseudouridine synthase B n=1 Tax=Bifidobacterium pluvialisilvae TaxID=2834436 RepID=UPI001C58627A|nr:tRNA pseudouridine(55) synthase TruB [Bifidobacterium pluvialisilvae]MBW3087974.1 tRNA pseudouridine(55) synthase TruB [Bifidobacterium pluvialisilvae]